jgi:hypothetical protein
MTTIGEKIDGRRILNAISALCKRREIGWRALARKVDVNYMRIVRAFGGDIEKVDFDFICKMARAVGIKIMIDESRLPPDDVGADPTPEEDLDDQLWVLRTKLLKRDEEQRNLILKMIEGL